MNATRCDAAALASTRCIIRRATIGPAFWFWPVIRSPSLDEVVGEEVARRMVPRLEARAGLAQRRLGMERRDLDADFVDLLVGDRGQAAALHEQLAVGGSRLEQAERAVADAADDAAGRPGLADLRPSSSDWPRSNAAPQPPAK